MVIDILCTSLETKPSTERTSKRETDGRTKRKRDRGRETDFRPTFILFAIQRNRRPLV